MWPEEKKQKAPPPIYAGVCTDSVLAEMKNQGGLSDTETQKAQPKGPLTSGSNTTPSTLDYYLLTGVGSSSIEILLSTTNFNSPAPDLARFEQGAVNCSRHSHDPYSLILGQVHSILAKRRCTSKPRLTLGCRSCLFLPQGMEALL